LGLLLETRRDLIPSPDDAFLVIDSGLRVQAVSRQAEELLAVREEDVVNSPVSELLVAADAEAEAPGGFAGAIASAAAAADEPVTTVVRPWNTFGVRLRARIAPCGPPRAALLLLETPRARRRLRLVD
jgi:PAS domain-containing protein